MTNGDRFWEGMVHHANEEIQLDFIKNVIAQIVLEFGIRGHLPEAHKFSGSNSVTGFVELSVFPLGNIGDKLTILLEFMVDTKHGKHFRCIATELSDYSAEDVAALNIVAPKSGLTLTYKGCLVMTIAGSADRLILKMEGLERSIIGLTADVPELWERVRAATNTDAGKSQSARKEESVTEGNSRNNGALRRKQVRERQERSGPIGQLGLSLPATTVLPVAIVGSDEQTSVQDMMFVPIRGSKDVCGAYHPRKLVDNLRFGLGVQTVLADYTLRAMLRDRGAARECLYNALTKTGPHLRNIGIEHLARWTEFDSVDQVKHWAEAKYPNQPPRRLQDLKAKVDAELLPIKVLGQALAHSERLNEAYAEAERDPDVAATQIAEAREKGPRLISDADGLYSIAFFGDINPVALGLVSEDCLFPLEAARVIGRVQAGAEAVLLPHIMPALFNALLRSDSSGEFDDASKSDDSIYAALMQRVRAAANICAKSLEPTSLRES